MNVLIEGFNWFSWLLTKFGDVWKWLFTPIDVSSVVNWVKIGYIQDGVAYSVNASLSITPIYLFGGALFFGLIIYKIFK